jgi:hypothetical protein
VVFLTLLSLTDYVTSSDKVSREQLIRGGRVSSIYIAAIVHAWPLLDSPLNCEKELYAFLETFYPAGSLFIFPLVVHLLERDKKVSWCVSCVLLVTSYHLVRELCCSCYQFSS